jgi:hypothetical protein
MNWAAGRASRYMYIDEFTVRGFIEGVAVDRWCSGGDCAAVVRRKGWHFQGLLAAGGINKACTFQKGWHFKGLPYFLLMLDCLHLYLPMRSCTV